MDKNNVVHITKDKILEASKRCKIVEDTLKILFPEVFIQDKPLFKIGQLLIRRGYLGNVYSLQISPFKGEVVLLNITHGTIWDTRIQKDKLTRHTYLSRSEFDTIVKGISEDFSILKVSY